MKYVVILTLLLLSGCDSANSVEAQAVGQQQSIYVQNQPAPTFEWSLERHLMIQLYRARNQRVTTYSYVVSPMTGRVMFSCPSMGYPIPATTQLTNTEAADVNGHVLPQAEPNGLYSPTETHATWVMCLRPNGDVMPVYIENDVFCSPVQLIEQGGQLVPAVDQQPSISLRTVR